MRKTAAEQDESVIGPGDVRRLTQSEVVVIDPRVRTSSTLPALLSGGDSRPSESNYIEASEILSAIHTFSNLGVERYDPAVNS